MQGFQCVGIFVRIMAPSFNRIKYSVHFLLICMGKKKAYVANNCGNFTSIIKSHSLVLNGTLAYQCNENAKPHVTVA